jgi:hypothetical protein
LKGKTPDVARTPFIELPIYDASRPRFSDGHNFAKQLKILGGLTPYEHICKIWTTQPHRFRLNRLHRAVGLEKKTIILFDEYFNYLNRERAQARDISGNCGRVRN